MEEQTMYIADFVLDGIVVWGFGGLERGCACCKSGFGRVLTEMIYEYKMSSVSLSCDIALGFVFCTLSQVI